MMPVYATELIRVQGGASRTYIANDEAGAMVWDEGRFRDRRVVEARDRLQLSASRTYTAGRVARWVGIVLGAAGAVWALDRFKP
jgi:hypothetical protein